MSKKWAIPMLKSCQLQNTHSIHLGIIDNWGFRKITPKEALRFQGFPVDGDYKIPEGMANSHIYKQAGNAVSVPVIKRIATNLLVALDTVYDKQEDRVEVTA